MIPRLSALGLYVDAQRIRTLVGNLEVYLISHIAVTVGDVCSAHFFAAAVLDIHIEYTASEEGGNTYASRQCFNQAYLVSLQYGL